MTSEFMLRNYTDMFVIIFSSWRAWWVLKRCLNYSLGKFGIHHLVQLKHAQNRGTPYFDHSTAAGVSKCCWSSSVASMAISCAKQAFCTGLSVSEEMPLTWGSIDLLLNSPVYPQTGFIVVYTNRDGHSAAKPAVLLEPSGMKAEKLCEEVQCRCRLYGFL